VPASLSLEQKAEEHGEALWSHDPNLCCYLHKIVPLQVQLTHPEVSAVLIEGRRI
jgi:phosphoadenosine phosphosulfate reductase